MTSSLKNAGRRRIIIATFASNIHRVQQIVDAAHKWGRKVAVSGRSMVNVVTKALELGYLKIPTGVLVDIDTIGSYGNDQMVIITTGSQASRCPPFRACRWASTVRWRSPERLYHHFGNPHPGQRKICGPGGQRAHAAGRRGHLRADVRGARFGTRLPGGVKAHDGPGEAPLLCADPRRIQASEKNAGLALSMGIPEENIFISDLGRVLETDGVDMKFNAACLRAR